MNEGTLITLEGLEGCGKSSVVESMVDFLREQGFDTISFREPGGTSIGEQIRKVLHDPDNVEMTAKTEALLYQAVRAQLYEEKIRPILREKGKVILLDRSRDSSTCYQGVGRNIGRVTIEEFNDFSTGSLLPDLTIYMDIDPLVGLNRKRSNNSEMNRMDMLNLPTYNLIRHAYKQLVKENAGGRFVEVDANKPLERVCEEVRTIVVGFLNNKKSVEGQTGGKERK